MKLTQLRGFAFAHNHSLKSLMRLNTFFLVKKGCNMTNPSNHFTKVISRTFKNVIICILPAQNERS